MKRTTFNILFFIKKSKLLKDGTAPIYLRITTNGKRSEIAIKRSITPSRWDSNRGKAKAFSNESKDINDYLNSIRGQIQLHQQRIQESGKIVTAQLLTNLFLGKGEKQWTIVELFTIHNEEIRQLKTYADGTIRKFDTCLKHIIKYCKSNYNLNDMLVNDINHKFITGFEFYLKTTGKCQQSGGVSNHIKALKKIIRIALANDYIKKDPFLNYKLKTKPVERTCLTQDEINRLINKDFSIKRLETVRDIFIFQCYTGLAYHEVATLKKEHIQIGIDGNSWIFKKRKKTGTECRIPILPRAQEILSKYTNDLCNQIGGTLLPVCSNQKMNAYLKEIADLCEIDKNLHVHLARHTFATTITLSNGIPIETVSKLLGHSEIQTTQIYAKVLDNKVSQDMDKLRDKCAI